MAARTHAAFEASVVALGAARAAIAPDLGAAVLTNIAGIVRTASAAAQNVDARHAWTALFIAPAVQKVGH